MTLVIIYEHTLFHTLSQLELLKNRLHVETRIKEGAENLLQVLDTEPLPDGKELARQVAAELQASKLKISNIHRKLGELQDSMPGEGPTQARGIQSKIIMFRSFTWSATIDHWEYIAE